MNETFLQAAELSQRLADCFRPETLRTQAEILRRFSPAFETACRLTSLESYARLSEIAATAQKYQSLYNSPATARAVLSVQVFAYLIANSDTPAQTPLRRLDEICLPPQIDTPAPLNVRRGMVTKAARWLLVLLLGGTILYYWNFVLRQLVDPLLPLPAQLEYRDPSHERVPDSALKLPGQGMPDSQQN